MLPYNDLIYTVTSVAAPYTLKFKPADLALANQDYDIEAEVQDALDRPLASTYITFTVAASSSLAISLPEIADITNLSENISITSSITPSPTRVSVVTYTIYDINQVKIITQNKLPDDPFQFIPQKLNLSSGSYKLEAIAKNALGKPFATTSIIFKVTLSAASTQLSAVPTVAAITTVGT